MSQRTYQIVCPSCQGKGEIMKRHYTDKRLPNGVTIYLNDWQEYVAIEFGKVAQICNMNVRMGRTVNEAVEAYITALEAEEWRMSPYTGE